MYAKRLAEAVADSVLSVGIRQHAEGEGVADELEYLIAEPLDRFLKHPNWPSAMTLRGVPFVFAIVIAGDGSPHIRCAVDVTDHRRGMAGNWSRYLRYAKDITDDASDQLPRLWRLFAKHLDGFPALHRSRVMHGVGYGPSGFKRSSLYFQSSWLSYVEFEDRFPDYTSVIDRTLNKYGGLRPSRINLISYDLVGVEIIRTKLYWRLTANDETEQLADIAGQHPDLAGAAQVFEHFLPSRNSRKIEPSLQLKLSLTQETELAREKLEFGCHSWGWNHPKGLAGLVAYLSNTFSLDLWPLYTMLSVFSKYKIQLAPEVVAIGPGGLQPSVSFYLCPLLEEVPYAVSVDRAASSPGSVSGSGVVLDTAGSSKSTTRSKLVDEMLARATEYILTAREPDGHWADLALPQGTSDEWVTAYITATLSNDPLLRSHLTLSAEWLQDRFRPGEGWGYNTDTSADADSTALSLLALHRMGANLPEGAREALLQFRLPGGGYSAYTDWDLDYEQGKGAAEITSIALLAQVEVDLVDDDAICDAVVNLVSQQRDEGGWNAFWWKNDLFATYRTLQALNAFIQSATVGDGNGQLPITVVESAVKAVRGARPSVSAQAIPDEPFVLGLWLSSWFAAQGNVHYPSVDRILCHLRSQQQEDGRWLSVPIRRIAKTKLLRPWARSDSGRLYLDSQCLVTTTTAIEGLAALHRALKAA